MKPEEVGYLTELDWIYSNELKEVGDSDSFAKFLAKWDYWLDASTRELKGSDWSWLSSLIADCRKKGRIIAKRYREVLLVVHVKEKHEPAMELLMPEKIIKVSLIAQEFHVPWGCAYKRMEEENARKI
jgi:hypothetical protein